MLLIQAVNHVCHRWILPAQGRGKLGALGTWESSGSVRSIHKHFQHQSIVSIISGFSKEETLQSRYSSPRAKCVKMSVASGASRCLMTPLLARTRSLVPPSSETSINFVARHACIYHCSSRPLPVLFPGRLVGYMIPGHILGQHRVSSRVGYPCYSPPRRGSMTPMPM